MITGVTELFEGRGGSSAGISAMQTTRILLVVTDTASDDFFTIIGGYPGPGPVLMPALYDGLDSNDKLTCRNVSGRQLKGQKHWRLEYEYSSTPIPREVMDRELFQNPLDRPARATGKANRYTTIPKTWRFITGDTIDSTGAFVPGTDAAITAETSITTSAGEPYDSLKEIDDSRWTFHFEKNFPADEFPDWLVDWDPDSVNSVPCFLLGTECQQRTLKLVEPTFSDVKRENDVDYRTVSFDIDYNAAGWDYQIVDRGFSKLIAGVMTKIVNTDGTYPTVPQLLDGAGRVLSSPTTTDAVIRSGAVYPEEDFNGLPINESLTPPFAVIGDL